MTKRGSKEHESLQVRVSAWVDFCFGESRQAGTEERAHRFLEEALELAQANHCTRDEAMQLVRYVFDRPAGVPEQEAGGVMVTLCALCNASGVDLETAAEAELDRNWRRIDAIRAKAEAKPSASPLPQ